MLSLISEKNDIPVHENNLFESLKVRDFRLLWISSACNAFGGQMRAIAQGWLIYDITQSPLALTWVTLSFIVPFAIFSLVGGVVADRISKKNIMIYAQLINGAATCVLAYIIFLGKVDFWHFIYFGLFNGAVGSLSVPASFSMVPEIVRQQNLVNATALQTSTFNLASITGPILSGSLIAVLSAGDFDTKASVGLVFFIISSLFFVAALAAVFMNHQGRPVSTTKTSSLEDFREGIDFVREKKLILGLMVMGLVPSAFGKSMHFLLPAFNEEVISGGPSDLGVLTAGMGIGALLGSVILAKAGDFGNKGRMMFRLSYGWAVTILLFALTENLFPAIAIGALTAFFSSLFGTLNMSLTQLATSQHIRGRVMSLVMVMGGITPLAFIPVGAIAEYSSIKSALIFTAIMLALSAKLMDRLFPELQKIDRGH